MQVHFSVGGQIYPGEPIIYRPPEDRIFENSRNISVKLHHRVGRFVKLRLSFPASPARWILISEVSFRSEPAARNYTTEVDGSPVTPPAALPNPAVSLLPLPPSGHEVWSATSPDQTNGNDEDRLTIRAERIFFFFSKTQDATWSDPSDL